jgi:hypothetical protein
MTSLIYGNRANQQIKEKPGPPQAADFILTPHQSLYGLIISCRTVRLRSDGLDEGQHMLLTSLVAPSRSHPTHAAAAFPGAPHACTTGVEG